MTIVFYDGKFILEEDCSIPVTDRGFLYGEGVFTTVRITNGKVEYWQQHKQRLKEHCAALYIAFPEIADKTLQELMLKNQCLQGVWRLKVVITAGSGAHYDFEHRTQLNPRVLMLLAPCEDTYSQPCSLTVYPEPILRPLAKVKTLAYLDRFVVMDYARQKGYDDAIVVDDKGSLLETAFSNLFWIKDKQLFAPAEDLPFLPGITFTVISQQAKKAGMEIYRVKMTPEELPKNCNVFTCNVLSHFRPVISIDERQFPRDFQLEEWLKGV